jgi:hypothetical protein
MAGIEDLTQDQRRALDLGSILLGNPEVAMAAKRLAKKAKPELRIPEVELEERLEAERVETDKRFEKAEQQQLQRDVAARLSFQREESTRQGLDPDEVDKRVVDEAKAGNPVNHAIARRLITLERQTAEPTGYPEGSTPPGTPIDVRPEKAVRGLFGNALRKWSSDTARDMVDGFRGRKRAPAR